MVNTAPNLSSRHCVRARGSHGGRGLSAKSGSSACGSSVGSSSFHSSVGLGQCPVVEHGACANPALQRTASPLAELVRWTNPDIPGEI